MSRAPAARRASRGIVAAAACLVPLAVGGCDPLGELAGLIAEYLNGRAEVGTLEAAPGINRTGLRIAPAGLPQGARFGAALAPDREAWSVGEEGDLAVGAPGDVTAGVAAGAVYLIAHVPGRRDFAGAVRLAPADGEDGDEFGATIERSAGRLYVGAPGAAATLGGVRSGAVYVFSESGSSPRDWTLDQRITPPDPSPGMRFGEAIAVGFGSGPTVFVGAPGRPGTGVVYVFEESGGAFAEGQAPLLPDLLERHAGNRFGASLSSAHLFGGGRISSSHLLVGAPGTTTTGHRPGGDLARRERAGAVYRFEFRGDDAADGVTDPHQWVARSSFEAASPRAGRGFGAQVLLDSVGVRPEDETVVHHPDWRDVIVVGAPGEAGVAGTVDAGDLNHAFGCSRCRGVAGSSGFGAAVALGAYLREFDPGPGRRIQLRKAIAVVVGSPRPADGTPDGPGGADVFLSSPLTEDRSVPIDFRLHDSLAASSGAAGDLFGAAALVTRVPASDEEHASEPDGLEFLVGAPGDGGTGAIHHFTTSPTAPPSLKAGAARTGDDGDVRRYLAFVADDEAPGPAAATFTSQRELRPPCRAEVTTGSFAPERRLGVIGGRVSFELSTGGPGAPVTHALRAAFTTSGLEVSAESGGVPVGSTLPLPGTWIADLAADYDGTTLRFEVRPLGGTAYVEVASVPVSGATFTPTFRIEGIGAGAEVGIDEPRVVVNGALPPESSAAENAVEHIHAAMDRQLDAMAALDAGGGAAEAGPLLGEARGRLIEARSALRAESAGARTTRTARAGRRFVAAALRQAGAAARVLARGRSRSAVDRRLSKVFAAEGRAIRALTDEQL